MDENWLPLRRAARRVNRSLNTVRRWKRKGMPTRLRDGRYEVHEEVLLKWFREMTRANPIYRARFAPTRRIE